VGIPKEIYDAAQEAHKAGTVLAEFEAAIRPVIDTLTQLGHTQKLSIPVAKATAGGAIIETQDVSIFVPRSPHPSGTATTTDSLTSSPP
jgi:hypothetical protein